MILMTLLSTALQEYPDLRVVLLIDDPPNPRYTGPRRLLDSALALPAEVERLLSEPRQRFDLVLERFESTFDPTAKTTSEDLLTLAGEYEYAAAWIQSLAEQYQVSDHNERFFTNHVLGRLSTDLALTGQALWAANDDDPGKLPPARLAQLYRRLAWTFRAEISSFQRKRYASLSAEPNKAMNLNSYVVSWLYKSQSYKPTPARTPGPASDSEPHQVANWELVLYMGFADRRRRSRDASQDSSDPDRAPLALPVSAPVVNPGQIGEPDRLSQSA